MYVSGDHRDLCTRYQHFSIPFHIFDNNSNISAIKIVHKISYQLKEKRLFAKYVVIEETLGP